MQVFDTSERTDAPVRVLLVEDAKVDAELVKAYLGHTRENRRYTVDHVTSLEKAISYLGKQIPSIILLDLNLPDSTSLETLVQLKPFVGGVPIVVLTGASAGLDESRRAIHAGAQDYLLKHTIDSDRLTRSIDFAIERAQRQKVDFEIASAGLIQQSILSRNQGSVSGLDTAARCEPAETVGGDFYDFVRLDSDLIAVALGDVSGHGLGPALLMAETRGVLRAVLQWESDPGQALNRVNRIMCDDFIRGGFITMFLGIINPPEGTLRYATAGHEGYILDQTRTPRMRLFGAAPPLGISKSQEFLASTARMHPNESVFACTDGIMESRKEVTNQLFGMSGVFDALKSASGSASNILDSLFSEVTDFHDVAHDDMTAVLAVNA